MAEEPHDRLFKQTFQNPRNAEVELRAVLPPKLLEKIELASLRPAPELTIGKDLSVRHCDILYSATIGGAPGYVYLLLEHQSSVDRLMPFRILEYVVRVISRHLEESSKKERLPLPVVIPVVVHHSESGWIASTEVGELFSESLTGEPELQRFIPRLEFILDDISAATDEELKSRAMAESEKIVSLVLWAFRDARAAERVMASFRAWLGVFSEVSRSETGRDALIAVISYLMRAKAELSREQIETIVSEATPEAKDTFMTLAEQLEQQGLQKGLQQGMQQGMRQTLTNLVQLKFGGVSEEAVHRISEAGSDDLTLWVARVLTAEAEDEVFR